MDAPFGKLVLVQAGGPELEFELSKTAISIGRAQINDIVLNDARVSRSHARLEIGPTAITIVDLGSSNGTRLNGLPVQRAELKPGDMLNVGSSSLRYETKSLLDEPAMTMIDTDAELERTLDEDILPFTINDTSQPCLVVITREQTWEVGLEDRDHLLIGRVENDPGNPAGSLVIEHAKVSRQHAEIIRKGGVFILRDLGSTNGTWKDGQRVEELILQNGDTFRIGEAQFVFKSGFQEQALTLMNDGLGKQKARRLVVFIPGMMGSELWLGNERVWPDVKTIFRNPEIFRYPSMIPLEPRGILDEVVIVPNLVKLDRYNRLGDYLVEELGYRRGQDFFEFAYDWRQDVHVSAQQLSTFVDGLPKDRPLVLVAHSLGTLVTRYYIERLNGKKRVERAILMGGPHQGVVKGLTSLLNAPEMLPFGIMGERLRQISLTFPASYQILPVYPLTIDAAGNQINFLEDESWVEEAYIPLLRQARVFRSELGTRISVPAISIFGYGLKTISEIRLGRDASGRINKVDYKSAPIGDSTVLESSAVCQGTEIHPVQQYHGTLFVDNVRNPGESGHRIRSMSST